MSRGKVVKSMIGLQKLVCCADCADDSCDAAHPNSSGSAVSHPKWCLRGSITTCELKMCPFNHFKTEVQFVVFRARDLTWRANNPDKVEEFCYEIELDDDYFAQRAQISEKNNYHRRGKREMLISDFITEF